MMTMQTMRDWSAGQGPIRWARLIVAFMVGWYFAELTHKAPEIPGDAVHAYEAVQQAIPQKERK